MNINGYAATIIIYCRKKKPRVLSGTVRYRCFVYRTIYSTCLENLALPCQPQDNHSTTHSSPTPRRAVDSSSHALANPSVNPSSIFHLPNPDVACIAGTCCNSSVSYPDQSIYLRDLIPSSSSAIPRNDDEAGEDDEMHDIRQVTSVADVRICVSGAAVPAI